MQKRTFAAMTLALTLPAFAAPLSASTRPATKPTATAPTAKKSTAPVAANANHNTKPTAKNQTAPAAVLLSKTLTPDGKTPLSNVKLTPVPDVRPSASGYYVVINVPQQRLFLYNDGALEKVYPVAVGKALTQTTLGEHKIGTKAYDPTWHIPKSIQAELKDGRTAVPPGPENPLGPVFVRLGNPKLGLGIHGTNAPSSVPGVRSHGCVRMKSEQALDFANTITTGSGAVVSYEMATLNVDGKNQLWLTAFKDPYNKNNLNTNALHQSIQAWAKENNVNIAAARVNEILKAKRATPVCISCSPKTKAAVDGSLMSIAWNSGSAALTAPKGMSSAVAPIQEVEDDTLENGEVEVDVGDEVALTPSPTPVAPKAKNTKKSISNTTSSSNNGERVLPANNTPAVKPAATSKPAVAAPVKSSTSSKPTAAPIERITPPATPKTSTAVSPTVSKPVPASKVNVKATSVFDDNKIVETPLYPVQPRELKPINQPQRAN